MEESARRVSFDEVLKEQGYLIYTATGNSMLPFLRQQKDIIEIHPVQGKIQKYQIALYKRRMTYVLHRCISTTPYVFAGDHNTFKEYDVTDDMILGVVTKVIRKGKTIYQNNFLYKFYYHLWVDFFPVKVLIIRGKARLFSIAKRLLIRARR